MVAITLENGAVLEGRLLPDATYEGDLMPPGLWRSATMALATGKPVQEIDSAPLTTKLRGQGAVMEWTARKSEGPMPGRR